MSAKSFAAFIGVLAVVGLLAFGVATKGEKQLEVGDAVPVVELEMLAAGEAGTGGGPAGASTESGARTRSIADYRGDWVLMNVWASWCIPCEDEAPDLVAFQEEHGRPATAGEPGFTILGVNTQDGTDDALGFVEEFQLNYPSIRDGSGDYADDLGTTGVPETILVDPEGNVAYARPGQIDAELLETQVLPLIEGTAAAGAGDGAETSGGE